MQINTFWDLHIHEKEWFNLKTYLFFYRLILLFINKHLIVQWFWGVFWEAMKLTSYENFNYEILSYQKKDYENLSQENFSYEYFWTMKKLTMNLSSYECGSYENFELWNERIA